MNSVSSGRGTGRSTKHDVISPFAKRAPTPAPKCVNDQTWFLGMCLLGKSVSVKTTDGYSYKGIFYGMKETEQGEMHLVLSHASRNDEKDTIPYAIIPYNVFASLSAEEVDLAGRDISATPYSAVAGFEDTANALDNAGNERKLEAFVFDGNVADPGLEDTQKANNASGWSGNDMFAENERRFGVTATFEESMYTTPLDGATISPEEAERLAQSIMAEQGTAAHVREDRGQEDDSGLTEEEKYGAVMRQPAPRPGGPPPLPPGAPPAAPPPGTSAPEDNMEQSPSALPPPGPPPAAAASGASNGAARSERQEINAVRLKLAEGKNLQTAVDPQLRTKYMNDAPAVDALNLMPGTGSHKFRKDKNAGVAHRLNDYKYKRQSSNSGSKPHAAALPGGEAAATADGAAPPLPAAPAAPAAGDAAAAAAADGKPSTTMKFNPDATPFNPKSAPFTPGKKAQDGTSSGNEGSGGGWGGRKPWQRERGDGVRGGRGRHGRSHDSFHGPQGSGRQGGGFMYQGHMGMQAMPSMIVSQPIPAGPRGAPMGQMPGGGYTPMQLHYSMPIHFNPQLATMPQAMHPMPMNIGTGGYPMQPGMQPGYTSSAGQSPPTGYVPPNV